MVRHGAPGVILRGGLGEPHVTCVTGETAILKGGADVVAVADLTTSGVHNVSTSLHLVDHVVIKQMLSLRVERAVDGDNVAVRNHVFHSGVIGQVELGLNVSRETMSVIVVKLNIEGIKSAENGKTDTTRRNGTDVHAFKIVGTRDTVSDVPSTRHNLLVGGNVIADKGEDHHDDVFSNADGVAESDLSDCNVAGASSFQVDVIRADTGGETHLKVRGLSNALCRDIGRPKRLRDHDISILKLTFED